MLKRGRISFLPVGAALAMAVGTGAATAHAKPAWQLSYNEPNSGNALVGLAAVDATHAWTVGVSSQMGNSTPIGLLTTDGATWFPMSLPPGSGNPLENLTVIKEPLGVMAAGRWYSAEQPAEWIKIPGSQKSTNGGLP